MLFQLPKLEIPEMITDKDWNVIYSYTRAQAIEDGVLIDVTVDTDNLYHRYFEVPTGLDAEGLSRAGRLHVSRVQC